MNILVFNANAGQFPIRLRKKFPFAEIFCCEFFEGYEKWLRKLGFPTGHCFKYVDGKKVLTFEVLKNMMYEYVVGNPPYQDGQVNDEAHKLWTRFIVYAFSVTKPGGIISMITPSTWLSPADDVPGVNIFRDLFQKNDLQIVNANTRSIQEMFGVGSTFTWWVCRIGEYSGSTRFITNDGDIHIDIRDYDCLPKTVSPHSLSILKKLESVSDRFTWQPQTAVNSRTQRVRSEEYQYPLYHTPARGETYHYSNTPHPQADLPKVMVSLSGKYAPKFSDDIGFTSMCIVALFDTPDKARSGESQLKSKLYRWLNGQFKHSGFNTIKTIMNMPRLDLSHLWTDKEVYSHFNLTADEVAFIEGTM